MAYEPALTSFILAGLVGGLAVVMSVSADWEVTHELARVTMSWTAVMVARSYDGNDASARQRASKEADILRAHGYEPMPQQSVPEDEPRAMGDKVIVRYRLV